VPEPSDGRCSLLRNITIKAVPGPTVRCSSARRKNRIKLSSYTVLSAGGGVGFGRGHSQGAGNA
jgi:hypothetical protein